MKKKKITYKSLCFIMAAVLLLSIVPLLMVSGYNVPSADDFTYGTAAHLKYMETGSFFQAVSAALRLVREVYFDWQGTFSAIFLMALQPAVFGEQYYFMGTLILLAAFLAGMFYFCISLFTKVFGLGKSTGGIIAGAASFLCIQLLPSPAQGFFWYNGSIYYTFFYSISLIAFALGIQTVRKPGLWRGVLLCILAAFLGGGNYVTALSCAIIGVCAVLLLALAKNKGWIKLLPALAFLLLAFLISMAAPGNAVRQISGMHETNAVEAILNSFKYGATYGFGWFSLPLLGMLVLLLPVFWDSASRTAFEFKYPALLTAFSYCLISAMFCPNEYALGGVGEKRLLNIIYYAYVFLTVLNCFYWTGWVRSRFAHKAGGEEGVLLRTLLAGGAVCLVCFGLFMRSGGFTSIMAISSVRSGQAQEYHAYALRRLETLEDNDIKDAVLEPFLSLPYVLYFDDITDDPDDWRNIGLSAYYGKDSVILQKNDQIS